MELSLDINTVLGVAIATLVASAIRWLRKRRFWAAVEKRAAGYLADPTVPIDDPKQATERALVDEQMPTVRRIANSIAPPFSKPID